LIRVRKLIGILTLFIWKCVDRTIIIILVIAIIFNANFVLPFTVAIQFAACSAAYFKNLIYD